MPVEPAELRTDRLLLRPMPPAAAAALLAGDRAGAERLVRAAFDPEWPLPDILDVFPAHALATDVDGLFGVWAVVEIAAGSVIGDIGFLGPQDATGAIEVGYSIVPGRRRRGYASEAAAALVSWAFERLGVPAIVAGTDSDNVASHRTLERLGFVRTDTTHDELRWRLERGRTAR